MNQWRSIVLEGNVSKIMYLKELTINGFKSFAKKGELEFSAPITAIVGPNGSGKSNVAESFRFVLGEQSVKAMRGKKGEDLIWGGSEKVSRGNRAGVEVVFDNSARTFALDFDEVKIERTVHRDGQNEYKLNGSAVRLKDVHELLAGANIGSTGHHIISQGEADRVLSAGPKERREMIEDALGLKVFQIKKIESERKLQKTVENIAQVESLRREAAPHLRYLKKQVERAERAIEVKTELTATYAGYLKREDTYLAFHTDRLNQSLRTPRERLEAVTKKLADIKEILTADNDTSVRDAVQKTEQEFSLLSRARQQAEQALSAVAGQVQFLENRLSAAPAELAPETLKGVVSKQELKVILDKNESLLKEAGQADAHVLQNLLRSLVKAIEELLETKTVVAVDTTAQDKAELERLQKELKALTDDVSEAVAAEEKGAAKLNEAKLAVEETTSQNHEAERDMFALREEQRELENSIRQMEQELMVLERDRDEFKRELQEAVALIGRDASQYFKYEIKADTGEAVTQESIVGEDRTIQRNRQRELEKLKIRLEELGIGNTEELLKEYEEAKQRDEFLANELADLNGSVENLRTLIADLQEQLREQFVTGIEKISVEFNRFFMLMFGGGSASLSMVKIKSRTAEGEEDDEATQEDGVELQVSLPNKRVKGLNMLSGGERALVSIAVIFAMSQVNPPPFIILDETDAALDEANSRRYGDMIEELAKRSQLVLITHNRETMSRAGILYGITMGGDGASRLLSVKFDEAAAVAK